METQNTIVNRRHSFPMDNLPECSTSQSKDSRDILQDAMMFSNLNTTFVNDQLLLHSPENNEFKSFTVKLTELENTLIVLQEENKNYKIDLTDIKKQLDESWDATETLERELNQLSQYNRRENIEISGIPDSIDNLELEKNVIRILREIGVYGLDYYEIAACHRLKKRNNEKYASVIVRFINRKRAVQCFQNRKYLKESFGREFPDLYIFENLCPRYRSIFDSCMDLKNSGEIKKLWTFNGIINFKTSNNTYERPKKIFHINDLDKYFPDSWD